MAVPARRTPIIADEPIVQMHPHLTKLPHNDPARHAIEGMGREFNRILRLLWEQLATKQDKL